MTEDLDIWRTANLLIKQHGAAAGLVAARRMEELLDAIDIEGYRVWLRVLGAIAELEITEPSPGQPLN